MDLHLVFLFLLSLSPFSAAGEDYYHSYQSCTPKPYSCGDVHFTLRYPFQIADVQPEYCGHPSFHLTCVNSTTLTITMNGVEYRVTDIDDVDYLLTVVDESFLGQTCPSQFHNNSIDTSLLEFTDDDASVAVYFNCTDWSSLGEVYAIPCLVMKTPSFYAVNYSSPVPRWNGNCSSVSVVRLPRTAVESAGGGNFSSIVAGLSRGSR